MAWGRSHCCGGKTLNAIPTIFGIGVVASVFGLTLLFYLIFSLRDLELFPSSEKSWPWPEPAPNGSARAADEFLAQRLPKRLLAAGSLSLLQVSQEPDGHVDR
jgi:hypothetical protein